VSLQQIYSRYPVPTVLICKQRLFHNLINYVFYATYGSSNENKEKEVFKCLSLDMITYLSAEFIEMQLQLQTRQNCKQYSVYCIK
jgi:hypothetical protein